MCEVASEMEGGRASINRQVAALAPHQPVHQQQRAEVMKRRRMTEEAVSRAMSITAMTWAVTRKMAMMMAMRQHRAWWGNKLGQGW